MTVYVLAQLVIHDRPRYDAYAARFLPVLRQFDGRLLAADEAPETLQGEWPYQKIVLLAFADRAAVERWMQAQAYQEIAKERMAATEGVVVLVQGVDVAQAAPPAAVA